MLDARPDVGLRRLRRRFTLRLRQKLFNFEFDDVRRVRFHCAVIRSRQFLERLFVFNRQFQTQMKHSARHGGLVVILANFLCGLFHLNSPLPLVAIRS